ncbi:cohesin domain-containing protein [Natronorubrum sp. DTA7]|uniref:cohesin domain-containing protein n=1 Tax=Natronorubrum sp. DTA7 TaxID=3447016 RepID=UPI003F87D686
MGKGKQLTMGRARRFLAVVLVAVLCASVGAAGFAGTAGAGDSATIFEVEPEDAQAPPGETIHVAIVMTSDGGYGGVGIERVAFGVEYDSDVLALEKITRGPWFEQDNETEIVTETDIDDEKGYAFIDQYRDPPDGGSTGQARMATLTFTVADDAHGETSPVNVTDVESELTNDWPLQSFTHNGSVSVDDDAEVVGASPPEPIEDDETAGGDDGTGDEPLSGFGIVAAVAVLAALAAGVGYRRA